MNWADSISAAIRETLGVLAELALHDPYRELVPKPGPPAGEQKIRRYEQHLGMRLPPSYRTFLAMHDGYEWLAFPGHMLSIEAVMPGGEYWDDIREWKLGMAEAGLLEALDGIVVAYLDQPNNWVYLDPDRRQGEELELALHVPGVDPDYFPDVAAFLHGSAARARLALSWARQRDEGRG